MTFIDDPDFIRPNRSVWRNRTTTQKPLSPMSLEHRDDLPWQVRYWERFEHFLIHFFDRFPDTARVFLPELRALEAELCPDSP